MPFTVFIDESGEAGISKVRRGNNPGASPYFVLGASVLKPTSQIRATQVLDKFTETISKKKWRHATDLDHSAKVYFAREASKLHLRFFSVISNKTTLLDYRSMIENDPQKFSNKCVQYLLERVCAYLAEFGVSDDEVSVILERRNHDYDRLIRFLGKIKENPIYTQSKSLRILNPFGMIAKSKDEEPLLKYADIVAHAVYQCVNKSASN